MPIEVTSSVLIALRQQAMLAQPEECCGLLLGEREEGNARVTAILPTANIHEKPETHFEIDPQALIDAHRAARAGGPQVVGYYHSHPAGPAQPSATDRDMASGDGRIWAIVGEDGDMKFWRDTPEGFHPLSYLSGEA